jgi:hypothetical protein
MDKGATIPREGRAAAAAAGLLETAAPLRRGAVNPAAPHTSASARKATRDPFIFKKFQDRVASCFKICKKGTVSPAISPTSLELSVTFVDLPL